MPRKSSRNYFKALFSKSEASQPDPAEKDADRPAGEKKSFKFLKLSKKSKNDPEKPGNQRAPSAVEPSKTGEDREVWADNILKSKQSLHGTSSTSQGKDFSYSELDLRKPKRFATFSFGLRKKRMKGEDGLSKSTIGLHPQSSEEKTSPEPSQMESNQAKTKTVSQPELDSSEKFDIPSPPPVAINKSESSFSFLNKLVSAAAVKTKLEEGDPQKNVSNLIEAPKETEALMAIPEPRLEKPVSSVENESVPHGSSRRDSVPEAVVSIAGYQTAANLPSSLPQIMLDGSEHKAEVAQLVCSSSSRCDNDIVQPPHAIRETCVTEPTGALSHHQSTAPDKADSATLNDEPPQTSDDSNADTTITESGLVLHSDGLTIDTGSTFIPQENLISPTDTSPKTAKSVAHYSGFVGNEKSLSPVEKYAVYGALYESLLPPKFGQTDPDIHHSFQASAVHSNSEPGDSSVGSHSELTHFYSQEKSDYSSFIRGAVSSVPVFQSSATPAYDYATSQGRYPRVVDSIRKALPATDEVNSDTCSTYAVGLPEEMLSGKSLEVNMGTADPASQADGYDGYQSPAYLSVGSDESSTLEIYYSAEEDNVESEDEERYMVNKIEELSLTDRVKEAIGPQREVLDRVETAERQRNKADNRELKGIVVKIRNEDGNTQTEAQQHLSMEAQVHETGMFLVANDAKMRQKEVATTAFLHVKEEGCHKRKEELLASPVQQANKPRVCDLAPPFSEWNGKRDNPERTWTKASDTQDYSSGTKTLSSLQAQYFTYKDNNSSKCAHAAADTDVFAPKSMDAKQQGTRTARSVTTGEVSSEAKAVSILTSAVTDTSAGVGAVAPALILRSEAKPDATEIEHNRAPQRTEWADTITTMTVPQQVTVELSTPNTDRPCTEAADAGSEREEHLTLFQPSRGSLTSLRLPSAASGSRLSETDQGSVDKMDSVYGNLSAVSSMKNLYPHEEDEEQDFSKRSVIREASRDTFDGVANTAGADLNGADSSSIDKWKNRFEGISQYKASRPDNFYFSDSQDYTLSHTSSVAPGTTTYKYQDATFFASSSPFPEKRGSLANALNDRAEVYLRYEGEPAEQEEDEWRRSSARQEEPAAPAGERERRRGGELEEENSRWSSQQRPFSDVSSEQRSSSAPSNSFQEDDDPSQFTGVFQATLVELIPDPAAPSCTPPSSPEEDSPNQFDMDVFVDTLKSMEPTFRPRNTSIRAPAPVLMSSLPPIVEDSSSAAVVDVPDSVTMPTNKMEATASSKESNGLYTLTAELGLKKNIFRDGRSSLEIRMNNQEYLGTKDVTSPLRASARSNLMLRKPFEDPPVSNGNGGIPSSPSSRLENSVIFGRTSSIDQTLENRQAHRALFRTSSLPETSLSNDRMSVAPKEVEPGMAEPVLSRFERFSLLLNSSSSPSGSLTGAEDSSFRASRPPLGLGSPPLNSPTHLLSPTGSIELHRPFTSDSHLSKFSHTPGVGMGVGTGRAGAPILQKSRSEETAVAVQQNPPFSVDHRGLQLHPQEPDRNLLLKYRAFPDAYLTKEKEHGKLNPRPGKMYIFDRPGKSGRKLEIRSDISDGTSMELPETISISVVRGGWVLYEKPNFKGDKLALDEGDIELTYPFGLPEEQQENGSQEDKEVKEEAGDAKPPRRFIIGSIRRAVRDYSVPEISLFPEQNAEGKKVTFRDTSEDARIFGFPIKANSIIINAGLWLVFAHPFFQGVPRVLEVGGYADPEAWGVDEPYVGSLHPLKIGEPRVENISEPKIVIYHKPYFTGKSRAITSNMRDFINRVEQDQTAFMYNAGSIKVLGGIWVGYEKEGYRGHQYLLEEGEYQDWRVWGGCDAELRSVRLIQADLTDPVMVMFEQQEQDAENAEENSFEVTEAIPDVELFEYKIYTSSIHVLSGAWIAYSHVDFSGNQYVLEKGFYNNCADWGSQDNRICSAQPILLAQSCTSSITNQVTLYSEPDFKGACQVFSSNQEAVSEKQATKSCKVSGGSWVFYDGKQFSGNTYVLSEGDYPNLTSMGCPPSFTLRSLKAVPMTFSVPSISLFGLECLEGREITTETEIFSLVQEGFNNHILSVRVNSGCWVICEHNNYRGRQFLLEPIEITNWVKFSSLQTIGSMYPVRQKRRLFRIKNKESGHFMSVQGGVEEMKTGRVVVTPDVEPLSDIWFYQDGFIKNKLSPNMSLQAMGNKEPGAKVVLWTETRQPIQTWAAQMNGLITSLSFCGMVLDVKGGKTYDKDHVVILPEDDERPSQQWEIELL